MDVKKLREYACKAGARRDRDIAEALGISPENLSRKINGRLNFTKGDIDTARAKFRIPAKEIGIIFF